MREIKFRVWNKNWNIIGYVYKIEFDSRKIYYTTKNNLLQSAHFVNAELMQYTGLKDKNDKEIYEGDIVKDKYGNVGVVRFKFGSLILSNECGWFDELTGKKYEVIGNVFENSELLEQADEN